MKKESHIENMILFMLGFILVVWFALLIAPYMYEGLFVAIAQLSRAMNDPFSIQPARKIKQNAVQPSPYDGRYGSLSAPVPGNKEPGRCRP